GEEGGGEGDGGGGGVGIVALPACVHGRDTEVVGSARRQGRGGQGRRGNGRGSANQPVPDAGIGVLHHVGGRRRGIVPVEDDLTDAGRRRQVGGRVGAGDGIDGHRA